MGSFQDMAVAAQVTVKQKSKSCKINCKPQHSMSRNALSITNEVVFQI